MRVRQPAIALAVTFTILSNALLLSGLVGYFDDTRVFDVPLRFLSSALAANGDLPLWYPQAGDGFPQLSLEFVAWTWNPIGALLGAFRAYDFLSLAIENVIWRLVGFAGAYRFARAWGVMPWGATAVAATYVGSGTMARAAYAFATLIGQMLAPWILVGGSLAIQARTHSRVLQSGAVLGLVASAMVWAGYPGAWVSAPVLSGPVLLGLASTATRGLWRLAASVAIAVPIAISITGPVISETLAGSTNLPITSRATESPMLVGHARAVDFIGIWLPNPSYLLEAASDGLQPVYGGILPPMLILLTVRLIPRMPGWLTLMLTATSGLIIANSQNWTLRDHPLLRDLAPPAALRAALEIITLPMVLLLPMSLVNRTWRAPFPLRAADRYMLCGAAWVALVATENPFANFLRFHVPPFALVRHNFLYFWLVTLLLATVAWRRLENAISSLPDTKDLGHGNDPATETGLLPPWSDAIGRAPVRAFARTLGWSGAGMLVVVALAGLTNHEGPSRPDFAMVGVPHLVWQASILLLTVLAILVVSLHTRRSGVVEASVVPTVLAWGSVSLAVCVGAISYFTRDNNCIFPTDSLSDQFRLLIDAAHFTIIIGTAVLALAVAPTRNSARLLIA